MKIRTRLGITAFVALALAWSAIVAIAVLARASGREMTINLMKEYTGGLEASLSSFFGDAIDSASYLAVVQGEAALDWNGELGGFIHQICRPKGDGLRGVPRGLGRIHLRRLQGRD